MSIVRIGCARTDVFPLKIKTGSSTLPPPLDVVNDDELELTNPKTDGRANDDLNTREVLQELNGTRRKRICNKSLICFLSKRKQTEILNL